MNAKAILEDLREFVEQEHLANQAKLFSVWEKPLAAKLQSGETQLISQLRSETKNHLILNVEKGDSRFREGDMICLHQGNPKQTTQVRQAVIEAENNGEWLVRTFNHDLSNLDWDDGDIYADPDSMDLKPFYQKALNDLASTKVGQSIVLPLLAGNLDTDFIYCDNYDEAADFAEAHGLNDRQIDAVAKGVAAKYLACIQGPPGTGKTQVISMIVQRLITEGQRVLVTSHTHMAINNALNKIAEQGVTVAKVGAAACNKGLNSGVKHFSHADDWQNRPDSGYAIGATPFATCSSRLENFEFDTAIFDEASQITVPLAVMAMRKARRYVFVGDHKQLPPVVLSKSVLHNKAFSAFAKLMATNQQSATLLNQTYRMNRELSRWPGKQYYDGQLISAGRNAMRKFSLPKQPAKYLEVFSDKHAFVFIESPGTNAKTSNTAEAELVVDLLANAVDAGLELSDVGLISPYRSHSKIMRKMMAKRFGTLTAKAAVVDTVERMQGQEREIVIVSLCTTDPQFLIAVAAFLFQSERLNVAITRPKTKLILIGPKLADDFCLGGNNRVLSNSLADYRSLVQAAYCYTLGEN
ncbi:MAG: AAA family ATPase [Cellvibrionaceae bacterium]|nr:AAA family ATPase [Cellvibrionaceae bacterium]